MTSRPTDTSGAGGDERRIRRHRTLPGGRAVLGAFLVTAAAVGVFAAYLDATASPSTTYLVALRDIAPGDVVDADDVTAAPIDLPEAQARRAVREPGQVVGRVALGPVRAGDLLTASTFLVPGAPPGTTTFSFVLPAAQALGGVVAPGDRIDVIATYGDTTSFVARHVPVVAASQDGPQGGVLLTVALDEPAVVLRLANALDTARVRIARTDRDIEGDGPPAFRPRPVSDG